MEALMEMNRIARRAHSVDPRATALDASRKMIDEGVGAVLVLDDDRLVGIVSERDIVSRVVVKGRDPEKTLVSEIMTADVKTVSEGASLLSALEVMHEGQVPSPSGRRCRGQGHRHAVRPRRPARQAGRAVAQEYRPRELHFYRRLGG